VTAAALLLLMAASGAAPNGPELMEDSVSMEALREFGPLEDREYLSLRARQEYLAKNPEGDKALPVEPIPEISVSFAPPAEYTLGDSLVLIARVEPPEDVDRVDLLVRRPAEATFSRLPMRVSSVGEYSIELEPRHTRERFLKVYVQAHPMRGSQTALAGGPAEPFMLKSMSPLTWVPALWAIAFVTGVPVGFRIVRKVMPKREPSDDQAWIIPAESIQAAASIAPKATPVPPAARPAPERRKENLAGLKLETNPYTLLRVGRRASAGEIDEAYHRLRKLHFYGQVHEPIKVIEQAYQILIDPRSRALVDEALRQASFDEGARRVMGASLHEVGGKSR